MRLAAVAALLSALPLRAQTEPLRAEKLVDMHKYSLEPNVRFSPDAKWVIFRSNMFGATYVFGVEIGKP
jgi:hypothetical protein